MIVIISPTKQMNFSTKETERKILGNVSETTRPSYIEEAFFLNSLLKQYSQDELADLMKMSASLAEKTHRGILKFGSPGNPEKAALFTYSGTVFQALDPEVFSPDDLLFAGKHLRILSGLYGILKPLDVIEPYRLEMKTPLKVPGSSGGLYPGWRERITDVLKEEKLILNLASDEYFKALDKKKLKGDIISISFKEEKDSSLRTVGMYAKKARGLMVQKIVREKVCDPEILKQGSTGGYFFKSQYSSPDKWVFVRPSK